MSDSQSAGFGKFIPGFDFLQNLAKGATESSSPMPNLGSWIAPSLNVEELDKRISELKTVQFWLEQNSKALGATVQALEVQKMTLATLKGMNVNISDIANSMFASAPKTLEKATPPSKTISEMAAEVEAAAAQKARDAAPPPEAAPEEAAAAEAAAPAAPAMVDPMQLWGALTQQFQQIAATALKEVNANAAIEATKNMASEFVKEAAAVTKKAAASVVKPSAPAKPAAKPAAKAAVKTPAKSVAKPVAKKAVKKVVKKTTARSS